MEPIDVVSFNRQVRSGCDDTAGERYVRPWLLRFGNLTVDAARLTGVSVDSKEYPFLMVCANEDGGE